MAAVKAGDVERVLRNRPAGIDLLLIYGPDAGLVSERARLAARGGVDDPEDAFQLIRLDGDAVADEPGRLTEEATTFGLFGGRRAIWVRPTSRNIAPAVSACLSVPLTDTLVVVEAGDLARTSPLRAACEASPRALALPCYADSDRDLGAVIAETLRAEGLGIAKEARELLEEHLGGDRLTTRGELAKLALYARGQEVVTVEDVMTSVSDVSGLGFDEVIDAAFGGDVATLDASLRQHAERGSAPAAILPLALGHARQLLAATSAYRASDDLDGAVAGWRGARPQRRAALSRQVRAWRPDAVMAALGWLREALLRTRQQPNLAEACLADALLRVAQAVRPPRREAGAR